MQRYRVEIPAECIVAGATTRTRERETETKSEKETERKRRGDSESENERKKKGKEKEKGRDALERQVCARRDLRVYLVSYTQTTESLACRIHTMTEESSVAPVDGGVGGGALQCVGPLTLTLTLTKRATERE